MQSWGKRILLVGLVFVAVWLLVIVYWRTSMHMPTLADVLLYLGFAPAALLSSAWLIRKMSGGLVAAGASANTASDTNAHAKSDANDQSGQMARNYTSNMVSGCVITRYGHSVSDLIDAVNANQAGFDLDTELQDGNGYPVLSGRIVDLQVAEIFNRFKLWETINGLPENQWEREDERTIVLAHNVFAELSRTMLQHPQFSDMKPHAGAKRDDELPTLYLAAVWPNHWIASQKQSVAGWFADLLGQQGWPTEKIVIYRFNASTPSNPYTMLDHLNVQMHRPDAAGLYIYLSGQSFIGEQANAQPRANGWIPGEAAAGMMLTNNYWAEKLAMQPAVGVHRVAQHRLDQAAGDSGKIDPDRLVIVIKEALQFAAIDAGQVAAVCADADTRANRAGELFEALNVLMPKMDVDADCFRVGAACGAIGPVAGLIALLIARQHVIDRGGHVLCVSNNDPSERTALILDVAGRVSE
ncbi:MAG: hypothetical protein P4L77_09505 [Sulfuriferula sp.]|nr:hypothetical protein [Sulfuriferula sp.]